MDARIEGLLLQLAGTFAPELVRRYDRTTRTVEERTARLARDLANAGLLVILGDQPFSLQKVSRSASQQIELWAQGYAQMYHLLCRELFPSFSHIYALQTDDRWPILIALKGEAIPVVQRLAGFIAPYLALRQMKPIIPEAELIGLMELILNELDGTSLPPNTYHSLRNEGCGLLRAMLAADLRHLELTRFDRDVFRPTLPVRPPPPPPDLPELPSRGGDTALLSPTQTLNNPPPPAPREGDSAPVFFKRTTQTSEVPRPPLPPLPKSDTSKP
jgi:hypothetical protein